MSVTTPNIQEFFQTQHRQHHLAYPNFLNIILHSCCSLKLLDTSGAAGPACTASGAAGGLCNFQRRKSQGQRATWRWELKVHREFGRSSRLIDGLFDD